ncbi:MAG TPA: 3-deoxy-manno-octulosonate cytidylyltransferase [Bacteroidetes bacterium]|nr:3-deoxy-manno-octulosonate cytidylyltransferase [Bacteroidota bacterium]HCN38636.1 3-deoxy-manno-octulosonate cytidylyltransferase [Bacteroidota bacterium]
MKITGVIPARWGSSRFPGKPLVMIDSKTMIRRVYDQAKKSKLITNVIVATDDIRIANEIINSGGEAVMTSSEHNTGTDRISEAIKKIGNKAGEIIVNIQGDEPFINPKTIDIAIKELIKNKDAVVSTPVKKISNEKEILNENIVKVAKDEKGYALYFSRSVIPFNRSKKKINYYKHIGLYVYRKNFLSKFVKMKQSENEIAESLEQLRILDNGYKIKTVVIKEESISIDTPADLKKIKKK